MKLFSRGLVKENNLEIKHFSEEVQVVVQVARNSPQNVKIEIEKMLQVEAEKLILTSNGLDEIRDMWLRLIPDFRILCLTAKNNAASMWYHYADKYKGVVIKLSCSDELDSPWLLAKPVDYPKEPPSLFSASGWAELIMMPLENAFDSLLNGYTYTKTPDWRYEEEWRITSFKRPQEKGSVSDYSINPTNFLSIYFGPLIDKKDRQQLTSLIMKLLPHIRIFDVSFGLNRKFQFTEINNG